MADQPRSAESAVGLRQADPGAAFFRAVKQGDVQRVVDFIRNNFDVNITSTGGMNALHLAAKEGNVAVATELLKAGIDPNAVTKKGNSALHIASLAGHDEVVRVLLQHGANTNARSEMGFTPLYCAAQENRVAVIKYLLSAKADPWLTTDDNFTPFAVALQQGHDDAVRLITDHDARASKSGMLPLHVAAKHDDMRAALLILSRTVQLNQSVGQPDIINQQSQGGIGFTPMHLACQHGSMRVAQLLFERGADVNFKARNDITPIHVAAKWGRLDMVNFLTERGAEVDSVTKDLLTPLHCAARSGHVNVVDFCLDHGANSNSKTKNGLTPLIMCGQGDHVDCGRILLSRGAFIDATTIDQMTALHVSAHCGSMRVCKMLLERKCDVNARAINGFTALHVAAKKNRPKVVELLLKYSARVDAATDSGLTPLLVAVFMGHQLVAQILLSHGANPHAATSRGETVLHIAARAAQLDIVRLLIRRGCNVNAVAREQQTPLHIAARLGQTEIVRLLLQNGALVDAPTTDNYTSLHLCAKEGHDDVAKLLLEFGAKADTPTKKGFTPLHLCAKYGRTEVAKQLLAKRTNADVAGNNSVTPLHVAVHFGQIDVARLLIEARANVHAEARNGYTPLHIAAKKGLKDCAALLLSASAKPSLESKTGFTPLHLASLEGHADVVELLTSARADPNVKARNGLRPIHLAAQENRVTVANVLQHSGAELDAPSRAGYTPLHTAAHFGQTQMIRFLLDNGVDVNSTTKLQYSSLCLAAQQGHPAAVRMLLDGGADPNMLTDTMQSALSIAVQFGYADVAQLLAEQTTVQAAPLDGTLIRVHPDMMNDENEADDSIGGQENFQPTVAYRTSTLRSRGDQDYEIDSVFYDMVGQGINDRVRKSHLELDIADQLREEMEYNRGIADDSRSTAYSAFEFSSRLESSASGDVISWTFPDQKNEQAILHASNGTLQISNITTSALSLKSLETNSLMQPGRQQDALEAVISIPVPSHRMPTNGQGDENQPVIALEELVTPTNLKRQRTELRALSNGHSNGNGHANGHSQDVDEPEIEIEIAKRHKVQEQEAVPVKLIAEPLVQPEPAPIVLADLSAVGLLPADNAVVERTPSNGGFLVSFLVDARGGVMRGTRYSGLRFVIPPNAVDQPTRVTCRLLRKDRNKHSPPIDSGEGLATRLFELSPVGLHFSRPILIEIPHFTSLRDGDREVVALNSDNGEAWQDQPPVNDQLVLDALRLPDTYAPIPFDGVEALEKRNVHVLLLQDLPLYLALLSRFRADTKFLEGGAEHFVTSTRSPRTQLIFPNGSLQKRARIQLQVVPVTSDLLEKYLADAADVNSSPIITIEPRRRKFHEPIHVAVPFPRDVKQDELTANSRIRLLCSINAGGRTVTWDDITSTTQVQVVNNNILTFNTTVSGRFWLVELPSSNFTTNKQPDALGDVMKLTGDSLDALHALYEEAVAVPYLTRFIAFGKRTSPRTARLRCMCITDERIEYSLEVQEKLVELARSKEIEILDATHHHIDVTGNLAALLELDESGTTRHVTLPFNAFCVNRAQFDVRLNDAQADQTGRLILMHNPFYLIAPIKFSPPKRDTAQQPTVEAVLDVTLPLMGATPPGGLFTSASLRSQEFLTRYGLSNRNLNTMSMASIDIDLDEYEKQARDFCKRIGYDWNLLARELGLTPAEIDAIRKRCHTNQDRAAEVYKVWSSKNSATDGDAMLRALRRIGRGDLGCAFHKLFLGNGSLSNAPPQLTNGNSVKEPQSPVSDVFSQAATPTSLSFTPSEFSTSALSTPLSPTTDFMANGHCAPALPEHAPSDKTVDDLNHSETIPEAEDCAPVIEEVAENPIQKTKHSRKLQSSASRVKPGAVKDSPADSHHSSDSESSDSSVHDVQEQAVKQQKSRKLQSQSSKPGTTRNRKPDAHDARANQN